MKGKNLFTSAEAQTIKKLIADKVEAAPDKQKGIRNKIRTIGFHYSDFSAPEGYTVKGFESLIFSDQIKIDGNLNVSISKTTSKVKLDKFFSASDPTKETSINKLDFNDYDKIKEIGFIGFKKMSEMFVDSSILPKSQGVYLILNPDYKSPEFLTVGTCGHFKGKNPNLSIAELESNWVDNSKVIYIGKATSLKERLGDYLKFGQGRNIGHYGGRLIWQLKNSRDLIVCWKVIETETARDFEKRLIQLFKTKFSVRPFANLVD